MVIIGGMGSLLGSFFGSAFIWALPIFFRLVPGLLGLRIGSQAVDQISQMAIGILIVAFLIAEPHGLARLWSLAKQKLKVWPFPY